MEDIYVITNTIQSAAIHTCIALGGHVQRLQGDGVFAYFGGKSIDEIRAVEMAITACSMFSYFVENDLKKIFLAGEIENICTRIGVDFGDEKDVMWANFGLLDVSELTTNSLHTSLASKMQAWATKNGIVVGQNVKDKLMVDNSLFDTVTDAGGNTKKFIFENPNKNLKYAQYSFDWKKFIKTLPYVSTSANGDLFLEDPIEKEKRRQAELRNIAIKVNSGNAYLNTQGMMNDHGDGVQHQPHRFHYGK